MNFSQKTKDYVLSSKAELEKVAWPSRQDTIRYSVLVVAVSLIVAAFFALLDSGLGLGVDSLLTRKRPAPATPTVTPSVEATTPGGAPADVKITPLDTGPIQIKK